MTVATESATPTSRGKLEASMHDIVKELRRMPSHFIERRAGLHKMLNGLLDEWEANG